MADFRLSRVGWLVGLALAIPGISDARQSGGDTVWVEKPTQADLARLAPPEALRTGVSGQVSLNCSVTTVGKLKACIVASESPRGMGFGDAALRAAPLFRLATKANDVELSDVQVRDLIVRFNLTAQAAGPPPVATAPTALAQSRPAPDGPPASIAALTPPTGSLMRLGAVPDWQVDFLDLDRIARRDDIAEVMKLTVFTEKPSGGERQGSFEVSGFRIDCRRAEYVLIGTRVFARGGQPTGWAPGDAAPQPIDPGSAPAVMASAACGTASAPRIDAQATAGALEVARRLLGAP